MHRLGPPVIVGEIAAGVVIGKSGFGWIDPSDTLLTGLAAIGFALLMFVVGTHLPVRDRQLRSALAVGAALAATVGVLAVCAGELLDGFVGLDRPAVLAVLLATSSGAVALPLLQSAGRSDRVVLVTTAWIAIADVATVNALPVILATGRLWRVVLGGVLVVIAGAVLFVLAKEARGRGVGTAAESAVARSGLGPRPASVVARPVRLCVAGQPVRDVDPHRRVRRRRGGCAASASHAGSPCNWSASARALPSRCSSCTSVRRSTSAHCSAPERHSPWRACLAAVGIAIHVAAALVWRLPVAMGLLASAQLGVPAAVVSIGLATQPAHRRAGRGGDGGGSDHVGGVRGGRCVARPSEGR